jgi:hypothetical protein
MRTHDKCVQSLDELQAVSEPVGLQVVARLLDPNAAGTKEEVRSGVCRH